MTIPFVIDNQEHQLAEVLNALLTETAEKPVDIATAYFSITGYRLVKEPLHQVGAFRLLIGSDPQTGADVGLRPNDRRALRGRIKGELEAEPFTPETLRLVEELIAFLRTDRVQVRLYDEGFLHATRRFFPFPLRFCERLAMTYASRTVLYMRNQAQRTTQRMSNCMLGPISDVAHLKGDCRRTA